MSHHVAVLLDEDHAAELRRIWADLEHRFGLHGVARVPHPHLSLFALRSPADALPGELARVARRFAPFRVRAHGYGLFCGDRDSELTLNILVVRSAPLSALQDAVREACGGHGDDGAGHFGHEVWTPHLTLADRDLTPASVGCVTAWLARRPHRSWSIPIDNVSALIDGPDGPRVICRIPLTGTA